MKTKFVILAVLDGWGIAAPNPGNAIYKANTVNMDRLWASYPHTQLEAAGEAVGLPKSEAGNSETGHINLGAGRIIYQDLARINMAIADGSFFTNSVLLGAIEHAKQNNSNLHLMGLIGAGGVHSNIEHIYALIQIAAKNDFNRVYLHLFTDGRDSPPTSATTYISELKKVLRKEGIGKIASIMGRYWGMDRDRRWDRTSKAYAALVEGQGNLVKSPEEVIEASYAEAKTDEFIDPAIVTDEHGMPISLISDNDAVVFYNFRIDRPRQLTAAFLVRDFVEGSLALEFDPYQEQYEKTHIAQRLGKSKEIFVRNKFLSNLYFVTMTRYSDSLVAAGAKVAVNPELVDLPLGRMISDAAIRQLRVAESEKERFVTFYFNGLREEAFNGEERVIIPSPQVPTYDVWPQMSAYQITDNLTKKMATGDYAFALINYANPDMVGHTGSIGPTATACEVVDECVGKIVNFTLAYGGTFIITADHGNAEELIKSQTGRVDTEHSTNPVPFIIVSNNFTGKAQTLPAGILADVAPTILNLLDIETPTSMTGRNLLQSMG